MKGLLSLSSLPYLIRTTGIQLSTNAINPSKLLAQLNPSVRYMLCVANGKNAAMKFSRNATPATELAAYFAYASTMYVVNAVVHRNMPNPTKPKAIEGTIQGTLEKLVHAKKNRPPVSPINDAGILRYSLASGSGCPGSSVFRFADAKYTRSCTNCANTPTSSPTTIALCTMPVPKNVHSYRPE